MTTEQPSEEKQRAICDLILERAAEMMITDAEAPLGMIIDRMITFVAAQACVSAGSEKAVELFQHCVTKIEAGTFNSVSEGRRKSPH